MMTRLDRAKQFAPFDAMKGLQEALRDREERHTRVEKHEISEDTIEEISKVISRLERGMTVEISCYSAFHDVIKQGIVTDVSIPYQYLKLGNERIWFDDIYAIRITDIKKKDGGEK